MATLVYLGIFHWIGWLLWMGLLLLPGMRHPKVPDPEPPKQSLLILGPICLVMLILCATPQPFSKASVIDFITHYLHHGQH